MSEAKKGEKPSESMTIDLKELYQFEPQDMVPDITHTSYSNLAYVQVTHRDVYIDFLEMPGIKKEGKMLIKGTRIYMSHPAAQKLSEALGGILEKVHNENGMEKYVPKSEKKPVLSTKNERTGKNKLA